MPTTHSRLAAAAVAATVAAASPATVLPAAQQPAFMQHMETFYPDVALGSAEYLRRAGVFADNAAFAVAIQAREQSGATHTALGSSPFASTPRDEFARQKRMPPRDIPAFALDAPRPVPPHVDVDVVGALPAAFDWTEHGAVTPVKDQGALGTCWAFSTAANIEGQDFLHGSMQLANYSVEQFVECDAVVNPSAGEADCGEFGGWPNVAYEYVIKAGGLRTWEDFPYCSGIPIGKPGNCVPCMAAGYNKTLCGDHHDLYCNASTTQGQDNVTGWCSNTERVAVTIDGWRTVSTNETEIAADLVATGPLSILLNAATLQFYHKGVADPALCNPSSLDHAVLLVGYGEDAGTPYWKVKNSWGTKWGEAGFFRMIRGTGKCGLNRWVTTAKMSE